MTAKMVQLQYRNIGGVRQQRFFSHGGSQCSFLELPEGKQQLSCSGDGFATGGNGMHGMQ